MVSDELITELQEIIRTRYGKDLSFKEVSEIGNGLVDIFDTLAQIDFREKYGDKNKHN